eukprot:m.373220 g.373220  ORF g.373220 m.373220 type:complete len:242 (+) comp19996_c0_seq28:256-981(+)
MAAVLTHPAVAAAGNGDSDGPVDHEAPVSPEGVLRYWCGGDPATNAKHKWFASVGSLQQTRMDAEVTEQYSDLLAKAERGELEQWHNSPRTLAALIIVLDQFSRHIHRSHRSRVDENDKRALALAQKLVAAGWLQSLEPEVYVFALMPLRHTPTIDRLRCVMDLVDRHAGAPQLANTRSTCWWCERRELQPSHCSGELWQHVTRHPGARHCPLCLGGWSKKLPGAMFYSGFAAQHSGVSMI